MLKQTPRIDDEFILQNCKHRWFNGLDAVIVEVRGPDEFVAKSDEGQHIIGLRQIKDLQTIRR